MDNLIKAELIEKYRTANNRLVLLDYDGTLVNYTPVPEIAKLSGQLIDILLRLVDTPQTGVFIITGRSYKAIDKILDRLPINIIADHGAMIKERGKWRNQINGNSIWKETLLPVLNQITHTSPGSFVEEKTFAFGNWHYRNAESESGYAHSRKLISILEQIVHIYDLKILDGNKVVELMNKEVGKGKAVQKLFEQNKYDFILSIGDDATDEEMFEFFLHISAAITIKVGHGDTFAKYKLTGISDVVLLLKHLSI